MLTRTHEQPQGMCPGDCATVRYELYDGSEFLAHFCVADYTVTISQGRPGAGVVGIYDHGAHRVSHHWQPLPTVTVPAIVLDAVLRDWHDWREFNPGPMAMDLQPRGTSRTNVQASIVVHSNYTG
jgi:hypothetical protein